MTYRTKPPKPDPREPLGRLKVNDQDVLDHVDELAELRDRDISRREKYGEGPTTKAVEISGQPVVVERDFDPDGWEVYVNEFGTQWTRRIEDV